MKITDVFKTKPSKPNAHLQSQHREELETEITKIYPNNS